MVRVSLGVTLAALMIAVPSWATMVYTGARSVLVYDGTGLAPPLFTNVRYSLITDGTLGSLTTANIVDFRYRDIDNDENLYRGSKTFAVIGGNVVTASVTDISFNFDGGGFLLFIKELDIPLNYYSFCLDGAAGPSCTRLAPGSQSLIYGDGQGSGFAYSPQAGNQVIASVASAPIPEPSAWALMIGGLAFAGATARSRKAVMVATAR